MKTETLKLSDSQKDIIKDLQKGAHLHKGYGAHGKFWVAAPDKCEYYIDGRLLNGLEIKGIIVKKAYQIYELTDFGKTIKIDLKNENRNIN